MTNHFPLTFMARPEFKRVTDLRGKRIGITRVGSSTHTVTLYVLNQAGLKPGDHEIVPCDSALRAIPSTAQFSPNTPEIDDSPVRPKCAGAAKQVLRHTSHSPTASALR